MISKGQLLIAQPHLTTDRDFGKSVILITAVNADGVVGFILNKPLPFQLSDIVSDTKQNFNVFNGGPVESENLYFLHSAPEKIEDGMPISETLYWGGSFEKAMDLLKQHALNTNEIRFFMGYSGWTYTQLEEEIADGSWIVVDQFKLSELFKEPTKTFWKALLSQQGAQYQEWINTPDDPRLN